MTRRVRSFACLVYLLAAFLIGVGCSSSAPTVKLAPVSGTVKCDGKPMADGTIYFKTPTTGAFEQLAIKDGKFEGQAAVGERRVEVTAYKMTIQGTDAMKGEVQESLVGNDYNVNSKLTATVTEQGPNSFTFEVKSK